MFIYEILFRGKSDGTLSGCHVKYGVANDINGKTVESIGGAEPVTGDDVQAIIGELATLQAETIAAKEAEISALQATKEASEAEISALKVTIGSAE